MGNTGSKENVTTGNINPPSINAESQPRRPRRRESTQALVNRAPADPPSASLQSAQGTSASLSQTAASAQLRNNQATHGRQRSHTTVTTSSVSNNDDNKAVGSSGKIVETAPATDASNKPNVLVEPISVPAPTTAPKIPTNAESGEIHLNHPPRSPQAGPSPASWYPTAGGFTRPPRLPLPIEEEVHSPGSPIISPADVKDAISQSKEDTVERQPSMLSTTTVDEEEWTEELQSGSPNSLPTYSTLIEWEEGGEKVYVTGSFAHWDRKIRLHRNGPSKNPDVFSTIIQLPAGTHHLLFLVDGVMKASQKMPTAVDFTTSLVNYVEVGPYVTSTQPPIAIKDTSRRPQTWDNNKASPSQISNSDNRAQTASPRPESSLTSAQEQAPQPERKVAKRPVDKLYHTEIPRFLMDLDAPEDSTRFQRASTVIGTQPTPPSLPMFLNKSILNGATPMKDDASVLVLPNHTVLNHLATSSIKNNVLATSATTRYKRKFLTTIMYKPTSDTGD